MSSLQSELRDRDRELAKGQELIRHLTAATRAATNEIDAQMAIAARTGRAAGMPPRPNHATPTHSPYPLLSATPTLSALYPTVLPSSAPPAPFATSYSASPLAASSSSAVSLSGVAAPLPTATSSVIHLRHHPGGRLSMDMSGGLQLINTDVAAHSASTAADTQQQMQGQALQFDELSPAAATTSTGGGSE